MTGFDAGSAALLLVDLQNEYRAGEPYAVHDYAGVLARAAALLAAARQAHLPVAHAQFWVEPSMRDEYPLLDACVDDATRSATAGSRGAELCAEVTPGEGEWVVRKRWPSAFRQTDLRPQLESRGVRHLVVCGVWTDSCVRGSVLDAVFGGFHVWLVKDACGSATPTMHRAACLDLANRLYGGGMFRAAEALKAMRGEAHHVWRCSRPIEFPYTLATLDSLYEAL